ncbi:MAG: hypothetical protein A2Z16_01945 [Chloroflexi bacterium RBG_16_54_18]|nr:MAG: hypothetical protein A2Z16_01945 [Chloroflexi bacterium RBG_16_54_18]
MNEKQSLQNEKHLIAGSRNYHFGIQLSGDGSRCLVIDEVQADQRNRIMVFEEQWDEFITCLTQVLTSGKQANETAAQLSPAEGPIFERLDSLVSDAYGKRTRIRTLLENARLDPIQSGKILQKFSEEVSAVVMENFRGFLHTRQHGDLLWKIIVERYGLAGSAPESYQGIAEKWNFNTERARQLVDQALRRLRLQQRRRRLEASLQANAENWLGVRLVEKSGTDQGSAPEKKVPEYILNTRKIYPRAYETWTTDEEGELLSLFQDGYPVDELAEHFGRQPGAIRSHLKKLTGEGD